MLAVHEQEIADNIKEDRPNRLYWEVPVTVDSIFKCPSTGQFYELEIDEDGNFTFHCPVEEGSRTVYKYFQKILTNHGSIDYAKETTW